MARAGDCVPLVQLLLVHQEEQADDCGDQEDGTHHHPKGGAPLASPLAARGMARWFTIVARNAGMVPGRGTQTSTYGGGQSGLRRGLRFDNEGADYKLDAWFTGSPD